MKQLFIIFFVVALSKNVITQSCIDNTVHLSSYYYGVVEVCHNQTWGVICSDFWDNQDASVVCAQLGYSRYGAIAVSGYYNYSYILPIHINDINCTGIEQSIWNCPYNMLLNYKCIKGHIAAISCQALNTISSECKDGDVRLIGGKTQYEGRVEICVNKVWGTICSRSIYHVNFLNWWSYYWTYDDSNVVCRQLGHMELGSVAYSSSSSLFGIGTAPTLMFGVACSGHETNLLDCPFSPFPNAVCSHYYDVGVKCEAPCLNGTVRLYSESGSYFRRYGRVEVCLNNVWGTVCDDFWDEKDASVICKMLGYSSYGASALFNRFTEGQWNVHINDLNCTGDEGTIWDCPQNRLDKYTCNHYDDAAVVCQSIVNVTTCKTGEMRLVRGSVHNEGQMEICINRVWGAVCLYSWNSFTTKLICKQLGYQEYEGTLKQSNHIISSVIHVYGTYCYSQHSTLLSCAYQYPYRNYYYYYNYYCDIKCEPLCTDGVVELYNGVGTMDGYVRYCVNGTWSHLCGDKNSTIDNNLASVICSELGHSPYGAISSNQRNYQSHTHYLFNVQCSGHEKQFLECNHETFSTTFCRTTVIVYCQRSTLDRNVNCTDGDVRLYGGSISNEGILHVCINRAWSAVCRNNYWTYHDAFVVCRQFGYPGYYTDTTAWTNERYPIMIPNLNCFGNEMKLNQCNFLIGTYIQQCTYNAVKIKCLSEPCTTGDVRLIGAYYYGRVQVCIGGVWGSICKDRFWDNKDASVICKQLGFSPNGAIAYNDSRWSERIYDPVLLTGLNCTGKEDKIINCSIDFTAPVCSQFRGGGNVICPVHNTPYANCTDGEIKLVGGSTSYEGTVQVCFNHAWGTISGYYWFYHEEAQTICNILGFTKPGAIYYRYNNHFGRGVGPIFISYLYCSRPRFSIFDCYIRYDHNPHGTLYYYYEYASHYFDIGVKCQDTCQHGDIRLQGSNNPLIGRVEVCINGTWGTVCPYYYWTNTDASVVCRQLGYSENGAIAITGYNERLKPVHIYDIYCSGNEKSILECPHNAISNPQSCSSYYRIDASVQCQAPDISENCTEGAVRLMDGQKQGQYMGRVEICHQNYWKSICPSRWNYLDAMVTCRQLGLTIIGARTTSSTLGLGPQPAIYSDFVCTGSESSLLKCPHKKASCSYSYHAGVKCEAPCTNGDVRLVNSYSQVHENYGRVEVCINSTWGAVCNSNWDNNDASVVCRQLGYVPHGAIANNPFYVGYTLSHTIHSVNCKGNESSLLNCSYELSTDNNLNCNSYNFATAICQISDLVHTNCTDYDIKLVDGSSTNEGKVVVCINGVWGLVCDNSINSKVAGVMCYQLGYDRDASIYRAQYSPATSNNFLVYRISCNGVETSIDECSITHFISPHYCDVHDTTGLRCHSCPDGDIRIIPYRSYPESIGRVEVCINGTWGTVCSDYFDASDAKVVCRQMGYSSLGSLNISQSRLSEYVLPFNIIDLNCIGDESNIWQCPRNSLTKYRCSEHNDAVVGCQIGVHYHNCSNGEMRLSEGISGRLEICFGNVWFGSFCYNVRYDRNLICGMLNYSTQDSNVYTSSFLGLPIIPMLPFQFDCYYLYHESLSDCYKRLTDCYDNYTSTYVGMICQPLCQDADIRLAGGRYGNVGRIDLCVNGTWGTICSNSFGTEDASVVCRQLGYSSYGFNIVSTLSSYYYPVHVSDLDCTGDEKTIWDCPYTNINSQYCGRYDDAAVVCQSINVTVDTSCVNGEVRLLGGINDLEGRVEICINKMWESVCDYSWDTADANVVCKQLGYQPSGSTALRNSYFGNGIAPYVIYHFSCSGSESSLLQCAQYNYWYNPCFGDHKAGVVCLATCNDTSIRLSGSSFQTSGRVELCVETIWTSICDEHWDLKDAQVVCRQMGFSSYGAMPTHKCYSEGQLSFGITSINCTGSENHLLQCSHSNKFLYNCDSHDDAGVICQDNVDQANCSNGDVRLVDGNSLNEGRVEVCVNEAWGTICSSGWNDADAFVVCRQLGYLPLGGRARLNSHFGKGNRPILLSHLYCFGHEPNLLECDQRACGTTLCSHINDAGVVCELNCINGDVRLGDSSILIGRVEVCINGTWGIICDNEWTQQDAGVICNQLGYSSFGAFPTRDKFKMHYWPVAIRRLMCNGTESTLWNCQYDIANTTGQVCSQQQETSVFCMSNTTKYNNCTNGEVRLVGGQLENEGNVQICYNNAWGSICSDFWGPNDANVVCGQLGFQHFGSIAYTNNHFNVTDSQSLTYGTFHCTGSEKSLNHCTRRSYTSCHSNSLAGVFCENPCTNGDVRVVGSPSPSFGRVEVCVKGIWGTICNTSWNFKAAAVICKQLGYSSHGAIATGNHYSNPNSMTNIDSVSCTGMESSILECNIVYGGMSSTCKRRADAEVICQNNGIIVSKCKHGDIRLVTTFPTLSFRLSTEGRVEFCINGVWGTICDHEWDVDDANVVCGQLGYFSRGATPRFSAFYGQGSGPVFLSNLNCTGSELKIIECHNDYYAAQTCGHYKDAGVQCLGSFPVLLSSSIGHILGGEPLIISGPTFNSQDTIHCIFGDIQTNGSYLNSQQCLCIVPAATNTGVVDLTVKITRGSASLYGLTKYRYIVPSLSGYPESVIINNAVYVTTGERVRISWKNIDILPETATVDIFLNIYNPESEMWDRNYVILKGVLYSAGQTEVTIPLFDDIDDSTVKMIKISVILNNNTVLKHFPQVSLNGVAWHTLKFLIKTGIKEISRRLACEIWHNNDNGVNNIRLPPCPCTIEQMRGDDRYIRQNLFQLNISKSFFKKSKASICYRQQSIGSFSSSQQCCYDSNGRLLTGAGGSTAYSVYPNNWKSLIGHIVSDMTPFYLCCWGVFRSCNYYYARRPSDNCRDWPQRPPPARTFGDPHLVTLDGHKYTFNGHGEFILLQSLDETLTIQVRMIEPITTYSNQTLVGVGTVISAIVVKHVDSDAVQFEILNDKLVTLVNGDEIDFTDIGEQEFENLTIVNKENRTISAILTNVGVTLTVKENNNFLSDIAITLCDIYYLKTQGLLGQYNGDRSDDLLPSNNNNALPLNSTLQEIHYQFGLTWIVDHPNMSLFVYGSKGWDFFYKPNFKPIFELEFANHKLQEKATEVCGNDHYCLFDVAATGDLSIGEVTKKITEEVEEIEEIFKPNICDPPCVYGACVSNGTCFCSTGYEGKSCDAPVYSTCEENFCLNGATCQILAGDYLCFCADGYKGPSCNFTNFTEPKITSTITMTIASTVITTKESNIEVIVGATFGVGTIFLILVVIATGLVCYFCRLNKKITETTAALNPIELDDEKISPSKTENVQPLNKDVEIESSS